MKQEDKPSMPAGFDEAAALVDYKTVANTFRKELETDYNAIDKESYKDWQECICCTCKCVDHRCKICNIRICFNK